MKKRFALAFGFVLALSLTACGGDQTPAPEKADTPEPTTSQTPVVYDDSLVERAVDASGSYEDEYSKLNYVYQVPRILDDRQEAETINREIEEHWGAIAQESLDMMEDKLPPIVTNIRYETYWNGSLLSLVMEQDRPDGGLAWRSFNYDFATGQRLVGYELAERLGMTENDLEQAVVRAVAQAFDRENITAYTYDLPMGYAIQTELRAQTISWENIGLSQLYLNGEGKLGIAAQLATPAGGGWYSVRLEPELIAADPVSLTVEADWLTARLDQDRVFLTFRPEEQNNWSLSPRIRAGETYEVEGLYGHYTDMLFAPIGLDYRPFLFLVDQNSQVVSVDLMGCAEQGTRFYAGGPLPGVWDVVSLYHGSFEDEEAGTVPTIVAHTKAGKDIDLSMPVRAATSALPSWWAEVTWTAESNSSWLTFGPQEFMQGVTWSQNGVDGPGWITCVGQTTDGLIFHGNIWMAPGEPTGIELRYVIPVIYGGEEESILLTHLSGPALEELQAGESLRLWRTWG